MKVLLAAAEMAPVARVGGLAEAVGGLVRALRDRGVEVEVVLPDYGDVSLQRQSELELDSPWWAGPTRIRSGHHPTAGNLWLVDVTGMARPHPYIDEHGQGWPDNDHRFMAYAAAVAAFAKRQQPRCLAPQRLAQRSRVGDAPRSTADGSHHPYLGLPGPRPACLA